MSLGALASPAAGPERPLLEEIRGEKICPTGTPTSGSPRGNEPAYEVVSGNRGSSGRTSASRFSPAKNTVPSGISVAVPCRPRDTVVLASRFTEISSPRSTTLGSNIWKKCPSFSSKLGVTGRAGDGAVHALTDEHLSVRQKHDLRRRERLKDRPDPSPARARVGELHHLDGAGRIAGSVLSRNHEPLVRRRLALLVDLDEARGRAAIRPDLQALVQERPVIGRRDVRFGSFMAPITSRHQVLPSVKGGVPPPTPNLAPPS